MELFMVPLLFPLAKSLEARLMELWKELVVLYNLLHSTLAIDPFSKEEALQK